MQLFNDKNIGDIASPPMGITLFFPLRQTPGSHPYREAP
jgi:hypothetical protein